MLDPRCDRCARRVPWITLGANVGLTLYKGLVGYFGGSTALIADAVHSFTDIIGTAVVLCLYRLSNQPPDDGHAYGHGKAEYMAASFVYVVLLVLSGLIFYGGLTVIVRGETHPPDLITLLGAMVAICANVLMYRLGLCAGSRTTSPALLANAFENRADALSSAAVVVGIGLAILVHPAIDAVAAMVVGVIIFANCVTQLRKAVAGLVDEGLPVSAVAQISAAVRQHTGVDRVCYVKTRPVGNRYWVDVGIEVDGAVGVLRAQEIAAAVRTDLMRRWHTFQTVEVFVAAAPSEA